jgi:hypothetical protein
MTDSEIIPYVGYGNTGHISQETAETIHTSKYWQDKYLNAEKAFFALRYIFNKNLYYQEKELKINSEYKAMCERKIRFLSFMCFVMGVLFFGGLYD